MDRYLIKIDRTHQGSTDFVCELCQAAVNAGFPIPNEYTNWVSYPVPPVPTNFGNAVRQLGFGRNRYVIHGKERADTLLHYLSQLPSYRPEFVKVKLKKRRIK